MTSVDDVRSVLTEVEALAEKLGCYSVYELETYALRLVKQANVMDYSDVAYPESVLVAALILRLRRRLYVMEHGLDD